jgi:hypothetical protein
VLIPDSKQEEPGSVQRLDSHMSAAPVVKLAWLIDMCRSKCTFEVRRSLWAVLRVGVDIDERGERGGVIGGVRICDCFMVCCA